MTLMSSRDSKRLTVLTSAGTVIHGSTKQEKHEATLCSKTWNIQGIPGRIPGNLCLGCKYFFFFQDETIFFFLRNQTLHNLLTLEVPVIPSADLIVLFQFD